ARNALDLAPHAAASESLAATCASVQFGNSSRAAHRAGELRAHDRLATGQVKTPARGRIELMNVTPRRIAGQNTTRSKAQLRVGQAGLNPQLRSDAVERLLDRGVVNVLDHKLCGNSRRRLDPVPCLLNPILHEVERLLDLVRNRLDLWNQSVRQPVCDGLDDGSLHRIPDRLQAVLHDLEPVADSVDASLNVGPCSIAEPRDDRVDYGVLDRVPNDFQAALEVLEPVTQPSDNLLHDRPRRVLEPFNDSLDSGLDRRPHGLD